MSSIVTAVFKATIGLLVNKGRDKAADKLKDGDVTDEKLRGLIVREIEDVKKKLDGLSRKDLLASISFFKEGIELLYEVFAKLRPRKEYGAVTTQAACAEAFLLAQGMKNLELTDLDESAAMLLSNAKKRFEDSRRKATEAFNNEALATSDRILAMQYRVMATILETVDNPAIAVAPCRVCIEELNSLSAVRNSFNAQLKKGLGAARALFGKEERRKIISSVCHTNRVVYDVTLTIGKDAYFWIWPAVDTEEGKVEPLCDERVKEVLSLQGMEHCCVTWSFGQQAGEEEHHWRKKPVSIATNSSGHLIVGYRSDRNVKVFDSTGTFMWRFSLAYHVDTLLDLATDMNDNIYALVLNHDLNQAVHEFNNEGVLQHKFLLREVWWYMETLGRLTVTESGKVLVLRRKKNFVEIAQVDVYETDGRFVRSLFGEDKFRPYTDIIAANDGRVMVLNDFHFHVHVFSEDGDELKMFELQRPNYSPARIGFFRASEHVVVTSVPREKHLLNVQIYTKDGEFVRSAQIYDKRIKYDKYSQPGMTVTNEGRIAVICGTLVLVI